MSAIRRTKLDKDINQMQFRHIGGLYHWQIGPFGGTFYLTSRAKRNRRALQSRMRNAIRHEKRMTQIARHHAELEQMKKQRNQIGRAYTKLFLATR